MQFSLNPVEIISNAISTSYGMWISIVWGISAVILLAVFLFGILHFGFRKASTDGQGIHGISVLVTSKWFQAFVVSDVVIFGVGLLLLVFITAFSVKDGQTIVLNEESMLPETVANRPVVEDAKLFSDFGNFASSTSSIVNLGEGEYGVKEDDPIYVEVFDEDYVILRGKEKLEERQHLLLLEVCYTVNSPPDATWQGYLVLRNALTDDVSRTMQVVPTGADSTEPTCINKDNDFRIKHIGRSEQAVLRTPNTLTETRSLKVTFKYRIIEGLGEPR